MSGGDYVRIPLCEGRIENLSLGITVCHHSASLMMPNGDPRDRFFYSTLTLMIYSYILRIAAMCPRAFLFLHLAAAHGKFFILFCCLLIFHIFFLDFFFQEYHRSVKQIGCRSGQMFCLAWSGSKLFAKVFSRQLLEIKILNVKFSGKWKYWIILYVIYEPRSDRRDLLAIKVKSEIFTEKEKSSCCDQLQKIWRDYRYK